MDRLTVSELRELASTRCAPAITIYMPTHVAGEEGQQDAIRLKNLADQAEAKLIEQNMRPVEARELLKQVRDLSLDPTFWGARSHGLAVLLSKDSLRAYRLPLALPETVHVHERFLIRPLLPLFDGGGRALLLALSQNEVHLFEAAADGLLEIDVPGMPRSMDEALNYNAAERGSQVHSATTAARGKQAAVFHGHGGVPDAHKADLANYFRRIDEALRPVLHEEVAALVLAGVDYLLPIYRQANSYAHLADDHLEGNCDYLTPVQLHQRAWPVIEQLFQRVRRGAADRVRHAIDTARGTDKLVQIVPAAHDGRIDTLFLNQQAVAWGVFDPHAHSVAVHADQKPGDEDLLELAAVQTILHRGTVYGVGGDEMPNESPVSASLRY